MKNFWTRIYESLRSSEDVFLAMVVENSAHSPGTSGARMALFRSGESVGTIGGGVMEFNLLREGMAALEAEVYAPRLVVLEHRQNGDGEKSGMMCSGQQTNLYCRIEAAAYVDLFKEVSEGERSSLAGMLRFTADEISLLPGVDWRSNPEKSSLELEHGRWAYNLQILNVNRIAILGGGHCGLALSRIMDTLGCHITVIDDRPHVPTMLANRFADVCLTVSDMADAAAAVSYPEQTDVVVMTTDVSSDIPALKGALKFDFPYIGCMGSIAKIGSIKKRLRSEGVADSDLQRIRGPIGLPILSDTPSQIAVSIAAELLQLRRNS